MGKLFGSQTKTTKAPFEQNPWKPQEPFLIKGFEGAGAELDNKLAQDTYDGPMTAGMTPEMIAAANGAIAHGMAGATGRRMESMGQGLMDQFGSAYGDSFTAAQDAASLDPTQQTAQRAAALLSEPGFQGQIDKGLADIGQALGMEKAGTNQVASMTGNVNSSRAAIADDLSTQRAADTATNFMSQMQGRALDMANNQQQQHVANQFAAFGAAGTGLQTGAGMAQTGSGMVGQGFTDALGNASLFQQQNQNEIEGALRKDAYAPDMDLITRYMAAIGGNYGGHGFNSEVTKSPSIFQQLVGGASSLAGAYAGLK